MKCVTRKHKLEGKYAKFTPEVGAWHYPCKHMYENKNTKLIQKALQPFIQKFAPSKISRYTVLFIATTNSLTAASSDFFSSALNRVQLECDAITSSPRHCVCAYTTCFFLLWWLLKPGTEWNGTERNAP